MPTTRCDKYSFPGAKTDLIRGPDKIDTDQGESDASTPDQVLPPGTPRSPRETTRPTTGPDHRGCDKTYLCYPRTFPSNPGPRDRPRTPEPKLAEPYV